MIVDRFFLWVRTASVEQRLATVGPLVRARLEAATPDADEDARDTIDAALTVLASDPEVCVRAGLAETLAACDDAPRHLLLDLLWDEPAVAEIVAERCDGLIEAELVEAAGAAHPDVLFALARRRRVGPGLAAALAETVDRRGAVALLANPGAEPTPATLLRLVDRFGEYADLREALVARPHLPITVRHRVLEKLAETIGNLVVLDRRFTPDRAGTVGRDAKDRATVSLSATASDPEVTVLVEHLRHTGQLTTRLVLRAACVGDLRFVEEAIAVLARVPVRRVAALVADGRESAFRALYVKAGMPDRAFPAFAAALEVHRELMRETSGWDGRPGDRARFARRLVERVLTRIGEPTRRDADDLLALLRRFSADAAREQARAVAFERTREAAVLLAAPVAATSSAPASVDDEIVVVTPVPVEDVAPAVSVDPARDRISEFGPGFSFELEIAEAAVAAVAARGEAEQPSAPAEPDDLDAPVGLFDNIRLEDVPADWLDVDEAVAFAPAPSAVEPSAFLRGSLAA